MKKIITLAFLAFCLVSAHNISATNPVSIDAFSHVVKDEKAIEGNLTKNLSGNRSLIQKWVNKNIRKRALKLKPNGLLLTSGLAVVASALLVLVGSSFAAFWLIIGLSVVALVANVLLLSQIVDGVRLTVGQKWLFGISSTFSLLLIVATIGFILFGIWAVLFYLLGI